MDNENKEPLCEENGQTESQTTPSLSKAEEKAARKERMRKKRFQRRIRRNARIARGRHFKNFLIWLSGFLFLPLAIAGASFIVPISVITGNNGEYVSTELSRRSMFEAVRYVAGNYGELGFSDFPVIGKSLSDLQKTQIGEKDDGMGGKTPITLGELVYIDFDKLNTIKFGNSNIGGEVSSCVEVVATIDSLGGASALGDFGGLSVFTEEEVAGTIGSIDTSAADFNAKEYYYKTADGNYKRAYDDAGNPVAGLEATETVYYPPLEKVKLSELKDIIGDSFGRTTIKSLLATLGGDNAMLIDIVGEDTSIKGLKDFDINQVALTKVLNAPDSEHPDRNKQLYDILRDATGVTGDTVEEKNANIKIGDLSSISTDDIYLSTVLPINTESQNLYDILSDLTGETATEIKVSSLSGLNTDNLHLTTVLPYDGNEKLYRTLKDLTNNTEATAITVGNLSGIDTDDLHLNILLPIDGNETLYDILLDGINPSLGITEREDLTVGSLDSFDQNRIKLETVIGSSSNKILNSLIAKEATLGNIGTKINDLEMTDIFDVECFTDDPLNAIDTASKYVYDDTLGTYTLDETGTIGTYYISKDAKVWLFVLYDGSGVSTATDTKGSVSVYTAQTVKLYGNGGTDVSLQDRLEMVSSLLMDATVRQLVQTGILTETPSGKYAPLYDKSFTDILEGSLV